MRRLLSLLLAGCATAPVGPIAAPLEVPRLVVRSTEPERFHLAEGAATPTGCFARSSHSGAFACVTGQFRPNGDGERRLVVLVNADVPSPPIELEGPRLTEATRASVNALLAEGDFVPFSAPPDRFPVGTNRRHGAFRIELERVRNDDTTDLALRIAKNVPEEKEPETYLFRNLLSDVACDEAGVDVREIDARTMLVERECRVGDQVYLAAALCSDVLERCD